jgi:hypothetical protein
MLANEALQQLLHVQLLHDTVRIQIKTMQMPKSAPTNLRITGCLMPVAAVAAKTAQVHV